MFKFVGGIVDIKDRDRRPSAGKPWLAILGLFAISAASGNSIITRVACSAGVSTDSQNAVSTTLQNSGYETASCSYNGGAFGSSGWSRVTSDGTLGAYAEAGIGTHGSSIFAMDESQASFMDTITITDPSRTGQTGTLVMDVGLAGSFTNTMTSAASIGFNYGASIEMGVPPAGTTCTMTNDGRNQLGVPCPTSTRITFIYGQPFTFYATLIASASFTGLTSGVQMIASNYGDTMTLAVSSILDADGNPVTGATLASDLGFSYGYGAPPPDTTVPEPASITLLASGIAILLGVTRTPRLCRGVRK